MELKRFGRIYGIYIGLILIFISYFRNIMNMQESSLIDFLLSFVLIGGIIYTITQYRDNKLNGEIRYKDAFTLGLSVSVFLSITVALSVFVHYKFIPSGKTLLQDQVTVLENEILKRKSENQKIKHNESIMVDSILSFNYYTNRDNLNSESRDFIYDRISNYFTLHKEKEVNFTIYMLDSNAYIKNYLENQINQDAMVDSLAMYIPNQQDLDIMAETLISRNKSVIKDCRVSSKVIKPHYFAFMSMFILIFLCTILTLIVAIFTSNNRFNIFKR